MSSKPSDDLPRYRRPVLGTLLARLREPRRHIQVLAGPRQTGKTTLARQALADLPWPAHYASADEPLLKGAAWLAAQWEVARAMSAGPRARSGALLVLDEVHKLPGWSETVKRLWDEDTARRVPLRLVLLGSSPLLVRQGLTESLAGRFELLPVRHWSFGEMREAFRWGIERFVRFGGYPGGAALVGDPERWARYVRDSLIETTVSRDVLLSTRIDKPALLRRLFELACRHSAQILSYNKMLGQLVDAGNTTTLAHYLDLLAGAGLVAGLSKHAGAVVRRRGSSPKLLALDTALVTAVVEPESSGPAADAAGWGRLVETAVGAHLVAGTVGSNVEVGYWQEGGWEVDYVLRRGRRVTALEVKSGRRRERPAGLEAFAQRFRPSRLLVVGPGGIPLEEFLSRPALDWAP
jgi:predicted AAA+ superfamily ATPase